MPRRRIRSLISLLAIGLIPVLTGGAIGPIVRADDGPRPARPAADPILGAALTILADGSAPWEDRPITVAGLGTLPGTRGIADPGDDTGPEDRVVRTWDAVIYRASFSIRDAPAANVTAEVTLAGPVVWASDQLAALRLAGCPGGAWLTDNDQRLHCAVGPVAAPPAVTVALDLSARVSGAALQGDRIDASVTVASPDAVPDPDVTNCPSPQAHGCFATAPTVTVSAAPAAELRKFLTGVGTAMVDGIAGRSMSWQLEVVLGADGDVRGSSSPVGAPWTLPDWWRAAGPTGRTLSLPVQLTGCTDLDGRAAWHCAQPGGPGTPVDVTIDALPADSALPGGVGVVLPQVVARARVDLWVPETNVQAARGDVTFSNCFATQPGFPGRAVWQPTDARGQANLGGMAEPLANNCSYVVLPVPRAVPPPRPPVRPPPPPHPGPGRPPPRVTPVPGVETSKTYTPYTQGGAVTDGTEFEGWVGVHLVGLGVMPGVIACDKWDNSTHVLREDGVDGARVWWQADNGALEPAQDATRVVVEYATGRWGRERTVQTSVGRAWNVQAVTTCNDAAPISGGRWVSASDVDFDNTGRQVIDARDVNMVRARVMDPVPAGVTIWLETLFTAQRNPSGTWLMNYAAGGYGSVSRPSWQVLECYGATGARTRRECPVPAAGTHARPGPLGDMLVHVGVPLWLTKRTDPAVPGGSPVVNAGEMVAFVLEAATYPRPFDPPLPSFPPGALAAGVTLTDTLPRELFYQPGSAVLASEDLNGSGSLDPGEDTNGNGRLDSNVPFEPTVRAGPGDGETTLSWSLGDLPYERRVPAIRYAARVSRLVRGGSSVANQAGLGAAPDRPPDCRPGYRELEGGRCAWAQVIVANIAAAQVEKVPKVPLVISGEPLAYRLALANLTNRPVEWFDAVDILPRAGEPRDPQTRLAGGQTDVQVTVLPGTAPLEVWASARDPEALDVVGGGLRDGLVDPVTAWGNPGAGLGSADWPCRLADVGGARCVAIRSRAAVTALRLWGPDPRPGRSAAATDSFLPAGGPPRYVDVTLSVPGAMAGDLAHNAWGGRFESLPLPVFDDAVIRVRAANTPTPTVTPLPSETPTPTLTATPLPPSATPTPSATATASPTPSVTPTATPRPIYRVYLPILLSQPCAELPVDVVLVVDASSSMLRPAGDGDTKLAAVLRAARAFLDRFGPDPARGRVALVAFNAQAWLVQPLTSDVRQLDAGLAALSRHIAEGTRLDLGLSAGADALGTARPGRLQAMVFLTDGLPNRVPTPVAGGTQEDTVLTAAAAARARGITILTVGYGRPDAPDLADRILPSLLIGIAGSAEGYYQTDDAGALASVFRRLATVVGCAGHEGWP